MDLKCLSCAGELALFQAKQARGEFSLAATPPQVEDAYTLAPSWQQQQIGPQMVMTCVAVPTCLRHLTVGEVSPADQALRNGRIIPGRLG